MTLVKMTPIKRHWRGLWQLAENLLLLFLNLLLIFSFLAVSWLSLQDKVSCTMFPLQGAQMLQMLEKSLRKSLPTSLKVTMENSEGSRNRKFLWWKERETNIYWAPILCQALVHIFSYLICITSLQDICCYAHVTDVKMEAQWSGLPNTPQIVSCSAMVWT